MMIGFASVKLKQRCSVIYNLTGDFFLEKIVVEVNVGLPYRFRQIRVF